MSTNGIIIEELKEYQLKIYAFDFINGAGAVVVSWKDIDQLESKHDLRKWMINYMGGYCAFWQIKNCSWLLNIVDRIIKGDFSESGIQTAKYMCDKLIEEINSGHVVEMFPKFYLCKNLK